MTATGNSAFDVTATYVHLPDGGEAIPVECTPEFWRELASGERSYEGRMMTAHHVSGDMAHWEMHPAGEELLVSVGATVEAVLQRDELPPCSSSSREELLVSVGATVEAVLQRDDGEEAITLSPGMALIVPRGVWHRIRVETPGVLVFITHGEGTEHKPL